MTEIELPKEHGLKKVARLVNFEVNEEQRKIMVHYREHLLSEDGNTVNKSEIKTYVVEDKQRQTRMIPTPVEKTNPNNPNGPKVTVMEDKETVVQEEDLAFTSWENQLGAPIRDAITTKLKTIYSL